MLLDYLESDAALRDRFFPSLDLIFYAAAALPQTLWERLEDLSLAARGERVPDGLVVGLTETSPTATVRALSDRPRRDHRLACPWNRIEARSQGRKA